MNKTVSLTDILLPWNLLKERTGKDIQWWRKRALKDPTIQDGIHKIQIGYRSRLWNEELCKDYLRNIHDSAAHQRTIELYLSLLPSNAPRRPGRHRKSA